jgi:DeoR/GlpR family transcriptional regulator of sugar metabolism
MNTRQAKIMDHLSRDGEVFVHELAKSLDVTTMTIRRDLDALEHEGSLIRTHGGAVLAKAGIVEFSFKRKGEEHNAEKRAIAHEVASYIDSGMTVALDTGTTVVEVAAAIAGVDNLTVLTSSLVIASSLYARDNIHLVLLGGKARRGSPDLTGWLTEENLKHFRVDVAVIGADGADPDGVFTSDESVARVTQAMIASAGSSVLALDHSKFARPAFLKYAGWSDFDHVVTDSRVPRTVRKWLRRAAPQAIYAKV